jgi:hypothetical protein
MERVSELIDQAGEMFSTLQPDIAQAIIAMVIGFAFVALPLVIFLFMFLRSVILKIKRDLQESKKEVVRAVNKVYASTIPNIAQDDDTDTQPIFIIREEPEVKVNKPKAVASQYDYRIPPEKFRSLM